MNNDTLIDADPDTDKTRMLDARDGVIWDPRADMDDDGDVDDDDVLLWSDADNVWPESEPTVAQAFSDVGNPFMFQGVPHFALDTADDAESATLPLNHHRARFADPVTGRWGRRDPIGYSDTVNLFELLLSNSQNYLDPWGLETLEQYMQRNVEVRRALDILWRESKPDGRRPTEHGLVLRYSRKSKRVIVGPIYIGHSDEIDLPERPGEVGVVHTHPKKSHDRGPSSKDITGLGLRRVQRGAVLIRNDDPSCEAVFGPAPKGTHYKRDANGNCISVRSPPGYRLVFWGRDIANDIDCEILYGLPPLGKHWTLNANRECILEDDPPDIGGGHFASPAECTSG
ncbi:MAG: hypothetical protein L6R00_16515 [Phycisphaerae bacterium]|nr:hypothetical protein [Phycisphaerae bacterium]